MHEEQDQKGDDSGEGQDAAPVDGSTVPPLQDQPGVVETIEPPVEPSEGDETKRDGDELGANQTD